MELRYEECPNLSDYIAFKYGPILLAANTTNGKEKLQNEYGGEGRMDHAPGSMAKSLNLTSAPLLIGDRSKVLERIKKERKKKLSFSIDVSRKGIASYKWNRLTLEPFYAIHHDRYQCYWYQQTPEHYANSSMAKAEALNEALQARTIDFVAPGEQQSEAGHEYSYSMDSSTGEFRTEHYRDARPNGYIQYTLLNKERIAQNLSIMLRFNIADKGRKATLTINGKPIADITIPATAKDCDSNGFFNTEYKIPAEILKDAQQLKVRLTASTTLCPGIYYIRLLKGIRET